MNQQARTMKVHGYLQHDLAIMLSANTLLGLLGIVGNVLCMTVWTRPQIRSPSAILLTSLAVADSLIIVFNLSSYTWPFFYYNSSMSDYFYNYIYPYINRWLYPMLHTAETASTYLTLTITLDRYVAVCFPFEYRRISTYSRSWKFVAFVIAGSILFNMIRFWEVEVVMQSYLILLPNNTSKITSVAKFKDTEFGHNPLYRSLYLGWMNLLIRFLLPLAGIMGFNTAIYCELKGARKACENITHSRKNNIGISMILMYVVAEFFVCTSTAAFFAIRSCFVIERHQLGFDLELLIPVNDILVTFNASINFVTYITFASRFRTTFLETCWWRKTKAAGEIEKRTSGTKDTTV